MVAKRPARTITLPVGEPDSDELVELPLVFTAERGDGPTTQGSLTARTASRSRRIGAEPFSPHSLRHRYTTILHDAGVPQRTIDHVVGHAPIGTTLAVYVEVTPESLAKVRAVLDDAWSSAIEQAMPHFSCISDDAAGR